MGVLQVDFNTEEEVPAQEVPTSSFKDSLAAYINDAWQEARSAKDEIEERLLKAFRQFKNEYEPDKLAAIKQLKGSEIFLPLTNIKCRAGEAWLRETLIQPSADLWDLQPTPLPELPETKVNEIRQRLMIAFQQMTTVAIMQAQATGVPIDEFQIKDQIKELQADLEKKFWKEVEEEAKESAEITKKQINDQFTEGGFYKALDEAIHDITIFPTAIIKGPIFHKTKKLVRGIDPMTGAKTSTVVEETKEKYTRISPFNIFPAPDSGGIDDGYLIELDSINPKDLHDLIGVEGYNEDAIREVLRKYKDDGLREWWVIRQEERKEQENKFNSYDSDKIDMIIYWGAVRGELLLEWGMDSTEIEDKDKLYDVGVWMIDTQVIKAILNPDPLGKKPYSKASFVEIPNSFWGMSIPEIIEHIQTAVNAMARATVNNIAIGSGPLVERNIDRIPTHETKTLYPWKVLDATDSQMNGSPAYRFYQPQIIADRLVNIMGAYMKMADELSGIPAYAHGDVTVGGAGRTASGLSMLTASASRGIKAVIRNIDKGLIESTVERQYNLNVEMGTIMGDAPDARIVAKGSIALAEKELQSVRRTEFLQQTMNPIDMQILGLMGRKHLLKESASAHGIDTDKLFEGTESAMGVDPMLQAMMMGGGPPGSAPPEKLPGDNPPKPNQFEQENGR